MRARKARTSVRQASCFAEPATQTHALRAGRSGGTDSGALLITRRSECSRKNIDRLDWTKGKGIQSTRSTHSFIQNLANRLSLPHYSVQLGANHIPNSGKYGLGRRIDHQIWD